jgi:hypothetical protein
MTHSFLPRIKDLRSVHERSSKSQLLIIPSPTRTKTHPS